MVSAREARPRERDGLPQRQVPRPRPARPPKSTPACPPASAPRRGVVETARPDAVLLRLSHVAGLAEGARNVFLLKCVLNVHEKVVAVPWQPQRRGAAEGRGSPYVISVTPRFTGMQS